MPQINAFVDEKETRCYTVILTCGRVGVKNRLHVFSSFLLLSLFLTDKATSQSNCLHSIPKPKTTFCLLHSPFELKMDSSLLWLLKHQIHFQNSDFDLEGESQGHSFSAHLKPRTGYTSAPNSMIVSLTFVSYCLKSREDCQTERMTIHIHPTRLKGKGHKNDSNITYHNSASRG